MQWLVLRSFLFFFFKEVFSGFFYSSWVKVVVRMGRIPSMLMLSLMQISNQCELVVTIKVPEIIVDTKKMGFPSIFRVCMGLIAYLADLTMECSIMW